MNTRRTCRLCGAALLDSDGDELHCTACYLRQGLLLAPDTPAQPVRPGSVFGSYELLEEIGRGGMGVVYRARQRNLNRTVAIKLLVSGAYSSEALLRRFRIEAESAAGLQHPGIATIYEFGEHASQPFYTMELIEGRNLAEVSSGRPLAPHRAATYLRAIAEAVQYAHSRGILHRDLKPSNVLVDQDDRPRITDFGLAKNMFGWTDVTFADQVLGSPNYSAPEQIAGRREEVGIASDVYGLGALLYHLLTGRPPFLAGSMQETLRLVQESDPVPPRVLNPDVSRDLDTICLKCLEKSGRRRYASARELAAELGRVLNGEPIHARPITAVERAGRWCRRHPAIASLAATVVVALAGSSIVSYSSARQIERARAQEHEARREAEDNLYAASMQVMSRAFAAPNGADPRGMREGLELSRPRAGERDHRGFEWRYFWLRTRNDALGTLAGHAHVVDAVLFSPDGTRLATHSLDGTLKIWDAAAGREVRSLAGVARPGGFTPDNHRFAFSRPDSSLWAVDLRTGEVALLAAPTGRLIALHPDGEHALVFGSDALPVLRPLTALAESGPTANIPPDVCVAVSANGRRAAVASPPGRPYPSILVLDPATRRQLAAIIDPRPVIGLALSPDGHTLVSAGFDGMLKVWNVDQGVQTHAFRAFIDPIWSLAFSPDGRKFAAGGHNREVKIWDTAAWEEREVLRGHSSTVRCIAFSPDGRMLVSGAEDELALLWPAQVGRPVEEMPGLLRGPLWSDRTPGLVFSPDSRLLAGTAADGTVKVWRADTMMPVASYAMDARTVAFSPDGRSVLGEGYDGVVRRWMLRGEEPETILNPKAGFADWQVDSLSPPERVALISDQAAIRAEFHLCEIPSARDGINAGAMLSTPTIAMSRDGRTMFVGLAQGGLEAWDVAARRRVYSVPAHKLNVTALAVSADGRYLASGSLDNSTKLWDAASGRHLATFHIHNRPVWALAFSPDSRTLASGSCDKEIILCSVPLRKYVAGLPLYSGSPQGYEQEVRLLRFSPDGNSLAAALGDGTVRFFLAAPFSETDRGATAATGASRPPG